MSELLSKKQQEALALRAAGLENKEIADLLNISTQSVLDRLNGSVTNLKARNITNAVAKAVESGIIEPSQMDLDVIVEDTKRLVSEKGLEFLSIAWLSDQCGITSLDGLSDSQVLHWSRQMREIARYV